MQCLWFILLFSDDLSFKKLASQSHSFWGLQYSANNAIDRKTYTCSRTQEIGYRSRFKTVWWKVDLGRVHNLYNIGILFKSYDGYGMYTYMYNPNNRKNTIPILPILFPWLRYLIYTTVTMICFWDLNQECSNIYIQRFSIKVTLFYCKIDKKCWKKYIYMW